MLRHVGVLRWSHLPCTLLRLRLVILCRVVHRWSARVSRMREHAAVTLEHLGMSGRGGGCSLHVARARRHPVPRSVVGVGEERILSVHLGLGVERSLVRRVWDALATLGV